MRTDCHIAPPQSDLNYNALKEPEGERIRAELIEWLTRNKIVTVLLDTDEHCVSIDIVKLPPRIKPVLTSWGSIFIKDDKKNSSIPIKLKKEATRSIELEG